MKPPKKRTWIPSTFVGRLSRESGSLQWTALWRPCTLSNEAAMMDASDIDRFELFASMEHRTRARFAARAADIRVVPGE